MRKILVRIGVISLAIFMLAGCSNSSARKDTDETVAERSRRTVAEQEMTAAETLATVTTTIEETEAETTESLETAVFESPVESGNGPTRGTWEGDVYTNTYAGITYTLPEGYTAQNDEQLATMMQIGTEIMGEAGLGFSEEALESVASLYDMFVMDTMTGSNIIVMFENLTVNSAFGAFVDETAYLEIVRTQVGAMEAQGMPYEFGEISDHQIGEQTYKILPVKASMEIEGVSLEMEQAYLVKKIDNYIAAIVITASGGSDLNTMISAFQ